MENKQENLLYEELVRIWNEASVSASPGYRTELADKINEKIKSFISKLKDEIVSNDIYTVDEIFRIINEQAGGRLI